MALYFFGLLNMIVLAPASSVTTISWYCVLVPASPPPLLPLPLSAASSSSTAVQYCCAASLCTGKYRTESTFHTEEFVYICPTLATKSLPPELELPTLVVFMQLMQAVLGSIVTVIFPLILVIIYPTCVFLKLNCRQL